MNKQAIIDKIIQLKAADIMLDLMKEQQPLPDFDQELELEKLSLWLVENGLGDIEQELKKRLQQYIDKELGEFDQPVDLESYFDHD